MPGGGPKGIGAVVHRPMYNESDCQILTHCAVWRRHDILPPDSLFMFGSVQGITRYKTHNLPGSLQTN